jgi:hypothetical protein
MSSATPQTPDPSSPRPVTAQYVDPLSHIWLSAASELGLRVRRSPHGYATTDGEGNLSIAPDGELDADDCLAQIILHELCHALVQGPTSFSQPDWGLSNEPEVAAARGDYVREQACLRVQAALLRPHGLRRLLGPTTDFRAYYDSLGPDPLTDGAFDASQGLAREALARAMRPPFRRPLATALRATADVHAALTRGLSGEGKAYDPALALGESAASPLPRLPTLWRSCPAPARHDSGLPMSDGLHRAAPCLTCESCAYATPPLRGRGPWRCQLSSDTDTPGRTIQPGASACALHRGRLDCQECGACCRHAYDIVEVARREIVTVRHPQLVEQKGRLLQLRRSEDRTRCAALAGPKEGPYGCTIYADRPNTCREFTAGTSSCVTARRWVGLECGSSL